MRLGRRGRPGRLAALVGLVIAAGCGPGDEPAPSAASTETTPAVTSPASAATTSTASPEPADEPAPSTTAVDSESSPVDRCAEPPPRDGGPGSESSLGQMDGVELGFAYLEGTVTALVGPSVSVGDDGFVSWPDGPESPGVLVGDVDGLTDLARRDLDEVDLEVEFRELAALVEAGEPLLVRHSDGAYEVGRRYGFVLGLGEPGWYSALFAHDLDGDCPAMGFDTAHTRDITRRIVAAAPQELNTGEAIAAFAAAIHAEPMCGPRSTIVQAVFGPVDEQMMAEVCDQTFVPPYAHAQIEVIDRLVDGALAGDDGRVPLFDRVPEQLGGVDALILHTEPAPDAVGEAYFVVISADDADLSLWVNTGTEATIGQIVELYESPDLRTADIGWSTAIVGEDVTVECGEVSPEGYAANVLLWTDGELVYGIDVTPVPECEPSPLSLDVVVAIARRMVACGVIGGEVLECEPLDPTAPR